MITGNYMITGEVGWGGWGGWRGGVSVGAV
jgi:hypothetical protein